MTARPKLLRWVSCSQSPHVNPSLNPGANIPADGCKDPSERASLASVNFVAKVRAATRATLSAPTQMVSWSPSSTVLQAKIEDVVKSIVGKIERNACRADDIRRIRVQNKGGIEVRNVNQCVTGRTLLRGGHGVSEREKVGRKEIGHKPVPHRANTIIPEIHETLFGLKAKQQ